jgi:LacI family transcriptional regulator
MGEYLIKQGHRKIMYLSDNDMCMDHNRYLGLAKAFKDNKLDRKNLKLEIIPTYREERQLYYDKLKNEIHNYTAIFCASDAYAIEVINYLKDYGYNIPEDISIAGFDDISSGKIIRPALTTIRQDIKMRASKAILLLKELIDGNVKENNLILPVELIERDSVAYLSESR